MNVKYVGLEKQKNTTLRPSTKALSDNDDEKRAEMR